MAQAFVTSYLDNFRWYDEKKVQPISAEKSFPQCDQNPDLWLVVKDFLEDENSKENHSEVEATVKQMQLKRYVSTYKGSYWKKRTEPQTLDKKELEALDNELLESCKVLYDKRLEKILPPLTSSRRINGYIRPSRLYTPKSTYQDDVGKIAYHILLQHQNK